MNPKSSLTLLFLAAFISIAFQLQAEPPPYRSPLDLAFSPDGKLLAVSDHTAGAVVLIDSASCKVAREVALQGSPAGVAWSPDGARLFAAEYGAGTVAEVAAGEGKVLRRFKVGLYPMGIGLAPKRKLLLAANTVTDDLSVIDLESGKERARLRVPREPFFVAITPDESMAVAGNLLPATGAAEPHSSAALSLISLESLTSIADLRLPPGSTSVRAVAISPSGKWAYAAHTLGRFNVPPTQLERGWVNTNALSIVDLAGKSIAATVLLDHPFEGAADPWGLALSRDGGTLWISLRGVHQLARIDLAGLHKLLAGELPPALASGDAASPNIWREIQRAPEKRALLVDDLTSLHVANLIERVNIPGKGPRGLSWSSDGKQLAVAAYHSGQVFIADPASAKVTGTIALAPPREPDPARLGEIIFHDATICFQHWMSCSTCHPDNARTDGLRWDLLNDGLGTPQRTRSMLFAHKIRPTTARGVRKGIEESVPKGLVFLLRNPTPDLVDPIIAYLSSLKPEPSPYLVGGKLSDRAARGQEVFEGKGDCSGCHHGELGTDLKAHDIGTGLDYYKPDRLFYTPKLVELYRTAPFLHDGRAATLMEVFTRHNQEKLHGNAANLTPEELGELVEYLNSR